jgi:hypothetical protein
MYKPHQASSWCDIKPQLRHLGCSSRSISSWVRRPVSGPAARDVSNDSNVFTFKVKQSKNIWFLDSQDIQAEGTSILRNAAELLRQSQSP